MDHYEPINLRTGLPGHGKTLFTIADLMHIKDRPVFYHDIEGIDEEKLGWQYIDDPKRWYELPENSVLIVDEAHKHFPVRRKDQVPEYIERLGEIRHKGIELHLVTQHPTSVDIFIRRRVGRHIHVVRPFGSEACNYISFPRYTDDPTDRQAQREAQTKLRRYPKEVYNLYKSAEVHTIKKRVPFKLLLLPVLILGAFAAAGLALATIMEFGESDSAGESAPASSGQTAVAGAPDQQTPAQDLQQALRDFELSKVRYMIQHQERLGALPWTTEFYSEVFQAVDYPVPHCVSLRNRCQCYTQQGTRLAIPPQDCRWYVQNGFFDPTRRRVEVEPVSLDDEIRRIGRTIALLRDDEIIVPKTSDDQRTTDQGETLEKSK